MNPKETVQVGTKIKKLMQSAKGKQSNYWYSAEITSVKKGEAYPIQAKFSYDNKMASWTWFEFKTEMDNNLLRFA